ncbi:hypothetical protein P152DRAFT_22845 [Eremomyces bilateralis CBS 781.70]|uniref:Uncharacterized protein n=1 Tax=Eremomyces bilateralis CBS 781.70 TaxID=1392243 RepID=A0A6G1GHJ6_9PEZI|nr:uncharacterized protein P152DRAFT_22845 [Eremomyces bilateralis CBS 781.70]KAF1817548.1 hypothetical protein P152DRAFT_22845 [Eremomyces bilateralis CBS 781.70]
MDSKRDSNSPNPMESSLALATVSKSGPERGRPKGSKNKLHGLNPSRRSARIATLEPRPTAQRQASQSAKAKAKSSRSATAATRKQHGPLSKVTKTTANPSKKRGRGRPAGSKTKVKNSLLAFGRLGCRWKVVFRGNVLHQIRSRESQRKFGRIFTPGFQL